MDKNEIERKIGEVISRFEDVDIAYIFGSFLDSEKFNDIDVAIVINKELNAYNRFKFDFQHEVLKKGIVIFKRDENRRIEYEAALISTYLDIKYMYEFLDKKFLARI